ncbi:hypothetical protein Taro_016608 [Colocasia esculenta]|uniref:J domain-containing protein n=1 Tax=Colocasia esculenta TaxID=4460 RepID=A0A843UKT6_COLES|nr:hypothetical protein [Colocasia esculenta]
MWLRTAQRNRAHDCTPRPVPREGAEAAVIVVPVSVVWADVEYHLKRGKRNPFSDKSMSPAWHPIRWRVGMEGNPKSILCGGNKRAARKLEGSLLEQGVYSFEIHEIDPRRLPSPPPACGKIPVVDYYKILEVDYDATEEDIRLSYRKLALKWHPDKHKGANDVTAKFQEINEAYRVLSDPDKRLDYDLSGSYEINRYTLREYLSRFKGMILTSNGLGINPPQNW